MSEEAGSAARNVHILFFNVLLALVAVHVATVLIYKFIKKHDLITPMFSGCKMLAGQLPALQFAGAGKFLAALAVAAAAVWLVVNID